MLCYVFLLMPSVSAFIVGGCIGPKSVLERYLNDPQKAELRKMIHTQFDGSNSQHVLSSVNTYVHERISSEQWQAILPELKSYQSRQHECSIYAQLLPQHMYKALLDSVWRASEMGASKMDVKRLVEDYVERVMRAGLVPNTSTNNPNPQISTNRVGVVPITPSSNYRIRPVRPTQGNGYRTFSTYRTLRPPPPSVRTTTAPSFVHLRPTPRFPTLVGYPDPMVQRELSGAAPLFPLVRPSPNELRSFSHPSHSIMPIKQ